jgi:hypothetical protein
MDAGPLEDASIELRDAASIPELPTGSMTLGFRNRSSRELFVITGDCNGRARWFDMRRGTLSLDIQDDACDCRTADPVDGCPTPPPVCQEDVIEAIAPGMEVSFTWDTGYWVQDGVCANRVAIDQEDVLIFRACWLTERPEPNTAGGLQYPEDFTCADVSFALEEDFESFTIETFD